MRLGIHSAASSLWHLWEGWCRRVTIYARRPSPHRLLSLQVTGGLITEPAIISP